METAGGCKSLVEIANTMHARGHETEFVIPYSSPVAYEVNCKVTRIPVPVLSKEYIPYGDIVLTNFYATFQPAYEAWPDQCVRFCQGFEPLWVKDKDFAVWTYSNDVPVISSSRWLDNQLFLYTGRRSTAIVPLGMSPYVFHPAEHPRPGHAEKVILYIARDPKLGYQLKGYDDFLKSMEILMQTYNGKFIVDMVCVESNLHLPGIPHRVIGPRTDREMAGLYRSADVFVSTSWYEGFGLPPLEAMACGTPVVTTNSGGVLEYAKHGYNVHMVEPKNPQAIAEGVREVLTQPLLTKKLMKAGKKSALNFTEDRFRQSIVTALEDIHKKRVNKKLGKKRWGFNWM
ncbi:glycosyltransferase family 4 protein [Cohnella suwonensis]|uniref:Glycosyltransferase family 4 protein n=1 Tax=Cohnella suwonensis TaxID=696072 RepID=A0ABW0LV18_9BACL